MPHDDVPHRTTTMCPLCKARFLNRHCPRNDQCMWTRCPGCKATLDVQHRRAYRCTNPETTPQQYDAVAWPDAS